MESAIAIRVGEPIAAGLEIFGIAVIAFAFLHATGRGFLHIGQKRKDAYERLRNYVIDGAGVSCRSGHHQDGNNTYQGRTAVCWLC
jgi:hypothetical protein